MAAFGREGWFKAGGEGGILLGDFLQVSVSELVMPNCLANSMFRARHKSHFFHIDHSGHLHFMLLRYGWYGLKREIRLWESHSSCALDLIRVDGSD